MTSIQGDCSAAEVHRRISETYGDREITKRATQAVLQTQSNWGAFARVDKGKRLIRLPARMLNDPQSVSWLVESALRYEGKAISLTTLQSKAVLYPFSLPQPLAYIVSRSPVLEIWSEGSGQQFVALREAIHAQR